jgi:hypothetical protein
MWTAHPRRISPPRATSDLAALAFEPDDVKALKSCREGSCDVQLPTSGIQRFRDAVDWSRPDAADQANALARAGVLQLVQAYRGGGNEALGEYRDTQHPLRIADQFQTMIGRASALPDVLPELRLYLLESRRPSSSAPTASSTGRRSRSD